MNRELSAALEKIKENEVLLLRNEKLSALGRMSAGIIHEINNPLNYANAGLHALGSFTGILPDEERADFEDTLKDIREGVARVSQIVIDLRQFTHDEKSESPKESCDITEVISRSIRMTNHQLGSEIEIRFDPGSPFEVLANPNHLVQVFINFLQNSIDAIRELAGKKTGHRGMIEVAAVMEGGSTSVSIRDNGIGIPQEDIRKIFDPFFTSKDVGQGMGLGLSITHQILQDHGVTVHVDSRQDEFTEIRLVFPNPSSSHPI